MLNKITKNALLSGILLIMTACGGGGGGGGATTDTGISYSGNTSQATLTDNNAGNLSSQALSNSGEGGALILSAAGSSDNTNGPNTSYSLALANTIQNLVVHLEKNPQNLSSPNISAVTTHTDILYGDCGGQVSLTFSGNTNGSFSGSMSFSSYCNGNETLSGSVTISGQADTNNQVTSLIITFSRLTFTSGNESATASGSASINVSSNTVTVDMRLRSSVSSRVCWVNNYKITAVDFGFYEEITITSGRFYDSEYGYVDVMTVDPLLKNHVDDYPFAGSIKITAINGASAILAAVDATTYTLDIDKDGDEVYETFQTGPWLNL